jgi:cytochrome c oxidase subunit II
MLPRSRTTGWKSGRTRIAPLALIAFLVLIALTGCGAQNVPSPLLPASSNAKWISNLTLVIFGIAAVVFVVVEGLLIYSTVRFSRKTRDSAQQTEGNKRLEIAWTLAPAIVLAIVFVVSLQTLRTVGYQPSSPVGATDDPSALHVRVVGHQWWWEVDYPNMNIVSANEMHVPVGTVVDVDVESVDVIHSYWVPQLGGKIDAIPGHVNRTWFQATQTGTYHGQCAEFCGAEHANMRFDVIVESPDQFKAWVQVQQAPVPTMTGDAATGEQVFMAGACVGCHTIDGTKAQGKVGPNLTHFASRKVFAGAILDNTPQNVAQWLADPQKVKPGALMPNLHLPQNQIDELVAFLESLK